jgi:hypothetical protein
MRPLTRAVTVHSPGERIGKSGLQGPEPALSRSPARAKTTTVEAEPGIGISPPSVTIHQGLGAEIARRSIAEQRETNTEGVSRLGAWSPPVELKRTLGPALEPTLGPAPCEADRGPCTRTSVSAGSPSVALPACQLYAASYGGERTALIRSEIDGQVRLTLLTLLDGFEQSLTDRFVATLPPGARSLGVYETPATAEAEALKECEAAGRR